MYTKFYGFNTKPFEITPDPKFLYLSESHREALAHLTYAVRERKGFTVITGEVGTGKTILIQTLLSRLNGNTKTAYLFNPKLGSTDFIHYICEDLGMKEQKRSKGQYINHLHKFLMDCYARNKNVVLIVDEAHTLDPKLLEEIRLLTNLETPKSKLLQVILIGQPELDGIIDSPQFRQLKQRVSLRYHLQPLNREETEEFIKRRLRVAGAYDPDVFTPKAIKEIYKFSKGIPRLINIVCDNALLTGYTNDQKVIGHKIIHEAIDHLSGTESKRKRREFIFYSAVILVFSVFGLGSYMLWKDSLSIVSWDIKEQIQAVGEILRRLYQETFK